MKLYPINLNLLNKINVFSNNVYVFPHETTVETRLGEENFLQVTENKVSS